MPDDFGPDGGGGTPPAGDPGTDTPQPPDPTIGGPNGDGPLVPSNVVGVAVTGDPEAVNPDGIWLIHLRPSMSGNVA